MPNPEYNSLKRVVACLAEGQHIDSFDVHGRTPLFVSCALGHVSVSKGVKVLLHAHTTGVGFGRYLLVLLRCCRPTTSWRNLSLADAWSPFTGRGHQARRAPPRRLGGHIAIDPAVCVSRLLCVPFLARSISPIFYLPYFFVVRSSVNNRSFVQRSRRLS